jgi:hypothetical protein
MECGSDDGQTCTEIPYDAAHADYEMIDDLTLVFSNVIDISCDAINLLTSKATCYEMKCLESPKEQKSTCIHANLEDNGNTIIKDLCASLIGAEACTDPSVVMHC